jgi:hypothetical protein
MAKKDNSQDKLINLQAQQLAAQVANWASQLDFAKERFRLLEMPQYQSSSQLEIDKLAFEKASETWKEAFQEASVTGTYQGQPTTEWLTQQAQLTGVLNGQQTLQGKLTDAQVTQMNEQMRLANQQFLAQNTGYLDGRPTFEREQWQTGQSGYMDNGQSTMARQQMEANLTGMYGGQSTMARQQMEAGLTGYYGGQSTLEREKFGAEQTQNYLNLLASLQGPGNAFKQLRVLNATPGGLQGMVNSWAGTYGQAGFGSSGAPGQAQISDLYSGYTGAPGQSPTAAPLAAPPPPPAYSPGQGLPPAPTYAGPVYGSAGLAAAGAASGSDGPDPRPRLRVNPVEPGHPGGGDGLECGPSRLHSRRFSDRLSRRSELCSSYCPYVRGSRHVAAADDRAGSQCSAAGSGRYAHPGPGLRSEPVERGDAGCRHGLERGPSRLRGRRFAAGLASGDEPPPQRPAQGSGRSRIGATQEPLPPRPPCWASSLRRGIRVVVSPGGSSRTPQSGHEYSDAERSKLVRLAVLHAVVHLLARGYAGPGRGLQLHGHGPGPHPGLPAGTGRSERSGPGQQHDADGLLGGEQPAGNAGPWHGRLAVSVADQRGQLQ